MHKKIILLGIIITLLESCSTEVDITGKADHKPVIYAILDVTSPTQYIKIHRTFLADGNVYHYTQLYDSIFYPYLLKVKLQSLTSGGNVLSEYYADTVHFFTSGDKFFTGQHPYYRLKIPTFYQVVKTDTFWFNPAYSYKLVVEDTVNERIYEAIAKPLQNFEVVKPSFYQTSIGFLPSTSSVIEWKSTPNGRIYEVKFIFDYFEIYNMHPQDTIAKSIEWHLGSLQSSFLNGGETMAINYNGSTFYDLLQRNIPVVNDVKRYFGHVWLVITVGNDDFATYIRASSPSNTIVQDKLTYTNISDALGLFAFRLRKTLKFKLNSQTQEEILENDKTKNLNFFGYFPNFE
ncbi:MAG: hypothetical protein N2Z72_05750 [Bacteroidales bacterium]|nr:hypothetical protein [Bacteroidales bacterium]